VAAAMVKEMVGVRVEKEGRGFVRFDFHRRSTAGGDWNRWWYIFPQQVQTSTTRFTADLVQTGTDVYKKFCLL
jgi:hypothetical protein